MPAQQIANGPPPVIEPKSPDEVRAQAVKQLERQRHFQMRAFSGAVVSVVLVIIWTIAEYNNAHGWPANGFSQSSGIYHVWNYWIIYPLLAIALGIAIDAWNTFRRKPISESEIQREVDRLTGAH